MRPNKCTKCQGTTTEGFLVDATYGANNAASWAERPPQKSVWGGVKLRGRPRYKVQAGAASGAGF